MIVSLVAVLGLIAAFTAAAPAAPVPQPPHMRNFELPARQPYENFQPMPVAPFKRSPFPEYMNAAPMPPAMAFAPFPPQAFGPRPFEMVPPASNAYYGFRSF
ncbi:unnamed protein product [Bursaphelenchus okinawaensis]|uniref:Uncharacterized protein n=1 Tax=Bursaphelenchus okinawaensis TaxID=465554 RepID=A0A811KC56_9BILA|nr:unnamed protein product [Bursaphelenchus okinawaensis]CAG9098404.1 unnamed protein product [Bursaphelenchus okinawaensis]